MTRSFAFTIGELAELIETELRRRGSFGGMSGNVALNLKWDFSRLAIGQANPAEVIVAGTIAPITGDT